MATPQEQVGKAIVPVGIAIAVLIAVALVLSVWSGAICH